jgi:anionic cell wall polymer biosynthesis LytR-Cps2A-Psr (LCP) family protein
MGKRRRRRSLFSRTPKPVTAPVEAGVTLPKMPPRYAPSAGSTTPPPAAPPPATPPPAPAPPPPRPVPAPAPDVVAPRQSRIERRRLQRQRQRRQRFSAVGILGVVAAIVAVVVVVGFATHHGKGKGNSDVRTQRTLLLQILGPDGGAIDSALLAHDPSTQHGVMLLVPSRVIADIPGHGDAAFGTASAVGQASLAQATLSDLIGVTVDGSISFDPLAFAKFIDRLGGITVDVDRDVVQRQGRTLSLIVARGAEQHLTGGQAVAYATYAIPGPTGPLVQQTELEDVLNGVLDKISTSPIFTSAVTGIGGVQNTMSLPAVGDLLAGLSKDANTNAVDYRTLDVKLVDTGGGDPIYSLDRPKVLDFVKQSLAASIPKGLLSGGNTVRVENGVGTPQLGLSTRNKLNKAGFVYVDGGNVPGFPYRSQPSVVVVFSSAQTAIDRGNAVAKALGLPATDVRVSRLGQSVADVIVLLGRDYRR